MTQLPASVPQYEPVRIPGHLAIIMDGNRRWARQRRLPGAMGHRAGARNVRPVVQACAERGVRCLTLFAFSTENWQRPQREIDLLMSLMRNVLQNDLDELHRRNVRVRIIGDRSRFPADLQAQMDRAESLTRGNAELALNIAANYGGRWDITQAARAVARAVGEGRLAAGQIDEQVFASFLSLGALPPPDLCVRTGGDRRISNFLLWDFAYTEFHFADVYWPDFGAADLSRAFEVYAGCERNFGGRR